MVIVSLIRIGRSNRMIKSETKLSKIFCKLKLRFTDNVAVSYWSLF